VVSPRERTRSTISRLGQDKTTTAARVVLPSSSKPTSMPATNLT